MDKTYILEEFDIHFDQDTDRKGNPDGLPKGGIMTLTFGETPDYTINEWMCRGNLLRDGEVRFLSGDIRIKKGADLVISFTDAYCIKYHKSIRNGNLFTTIILSPRTVKIGNEEFSNRWKLPEDLPYYIRSGRS